MLTPPSAWCLLPSFSPSSTYLGGTPYHPWREGVVSYRGEWCALLLQVDLALLPPLPPLPQEGYLQIFSQHLPGTSPFPTLFLGRVLPRSRRLSKEEVPVPPVLGGMLLKPEERIPLRVEEREEGGGECYLKVEELQLSHQKQLLLGTHGGHFLQVPGAWWGLFLPLTLQEELTPLRSLLL